MTDKTDNKEILVDKLQNALEVENVASGCFGRLSSLIKNGRVRNNFSSFSNISKSNQELLKGRLNSFGVTDFAPKDTCKFCKIRPESFSLTGAINLGLEFIDIAIKNYKNLVDLNNNLDDKKVFNKLLKEKVQQRNSLKKEREFNRTAEVKSNFIDSYCISEVISKLWK